MLKLTKSTDFALRILIYLAGENRSSTVPIMASKLGISYNHLSKIVQTLAKANIINTRQGKNGGVELNKKPTSINLKQIVDLMDGRPQLSMCLDENAENDTKICVLTETCKLKHVFLTIQDQIDHMFEEVNIAQMI